MKIFLPVLLLMLYACGARDTRDTKETVPAAAETKPRHPKDTVSAVEPLRHFTHGFYLDSLLTDSVYEDRIFYLKAHFPQVNTGEFAFVSAYIRQEVKKYLDKQLEAASQFSEQVYAEVWPVYFYCNGNTISLCLATRDNSTYDPKKLYHSFMAFNYQENGRMITINDLVHFERNRDIGLVRNFCDSLNRLSPVAGSGQKLRPLNFTSEQVFALKPGGLTLYFNDYMQEGGVDHDSLFLPEDILAKRLTGYYQKVKP